MSRVAAIFIGLGLLAVGIGGGYWFGVQRAHPPVTANAPDSTAPKAKPERKLLYYRNPMGLPDTSPVPKKDPMGMDYIPVYEGEEPQATVAGVSISVEKIQKIGVRTEAAALRDMSRTVRAVGVVQADERRLSNVTPRFEGWIQRLLVNTTGEVVQRGQPLMEVYSPDLVSTQQEYLIALRGVQSLKDATPEMRASMEQLAEGALQRLRNWEISEQELAQLKADGKPRQTMILRAPASGVVLEKAAVQGMRFMPGEMLYRIADLSTVWLIADVYEQDLALVGRGAPVEVRVTAYPDRVFNGKVSFLYPTVAPETRTAKARVELVNPGGLLKPDMYAEAQIASAQAGGKRLAVPDSAIIDSGTRRIVLLQRGEGRFEPREVKTGARGGGFVEITEGLSVGDVVVTSANFLIDAESNLKAALSGFSTHAAHGEPAPKLAEGGGGQTHRTRGEIVSVEVAEGSVTIKHEAVPALKWPAMTMPFVVKDKALLSRLRPGQRVEFGFVQKSEGEYAVTEVKPQPADAAHKGH